MRIPAALSLASTLLLFTLHAQPSSGSIDPPAGARNLLQAHGEGVQIYNCAQTPQGLQWTLIGPDAKLLDASGKEIGTHFAGPTWKLASGGQVQGQLVATRPSSEAGAVPWLLLRAKPGTAQGAFATVAFIQRTDTHGGAADKSACQIPADAGKTARVPYTATYTFYAAK